MVKASKGIMQGTRQIFRRRVRQRGLSPLTRALQTFQVGDRAVIVIDSSIQRGQPYHRFHGLTGRVVERRGRAYVLDVRLGGKVKQAIALPEHLHKV